MAKDSDSSQPLYLQRPLDRFSNRAQEYGKYRPTYPGEALDAMLEGFSDLMKVRAADVGAGTGIASRQLAERGLHVTAIEPNATMRTAAPSHPRLEYREGRAEATGLDEDSVDLVSCFQSFHWFQPEPTYKEFHRILKSTGRLALVWNDRDLADAFTAEYSELVDVSSGHVPVERGRDEAGELPTTDLFTPFCMRVFRREQWLDAEGLIGRARSSSQVPLEGELHDRLVEGLGELWQRRKDERGLVQLVYKTKLFVSEPIR